MPSNWQVFWIYPVVYLFGSVARAWNGHLLVAETEFIMFSMGWVLILFASIWLDRLFARVSTDELNRERRTIQRFIEGEDDSTRSV